VGRAIVDSLSRFPRFIVKRNWDGLESNYHNQAREWSGRSLARRIAEVDLTGYGAAWSGALAEAAAAAGEHESKAIFFEYDMDSGWEGRFLLCANYAPEAAKDEEWSWEWAAEVEGPGIPEFGGIFREFGFDRTDQAKGSTLYMIARTVAAVGRSLTPDRVGTAALCIGYRNQNPLLRFYEGSGA
jgi:hypothetical protein